MGSNHATQTRPPTPAAADYRPFERLSDPDGGGGIHVVVGTPYTTAGAYELTDGITLADVEPAVDPDAPVVLTAYERALDAAYDDWRSWPPSVLRHRLVRARVPDAPSLNAHPADDCERYTAGNYTRVNGQVRCERCRTRLDGSTAWVEHVARDACEQR